MEENPRIRGQFKKQWNILICLTSESFNEVRRLSITFPVIRCFVTVNIYRDHSETGKNFNGNVSIFTKVTLKVVRSVTNWLSDLKEIINRLKMTLDQKSLRPQLMMFTFGKLIICQNVRELAGEFGTSIGSDKNLLIL